MDLLFNVIQKFRAVATALCRRFLAGRRPTEGRYSARVRAIALHWYSAQPTLDSAPPIPRHALLYTNWRDQPQFAREKVRNGDGRDSSRCLKPVIESGSRAARPRAFIRAVRRCGLATTRTAARRRSRMGVWLDQRLRAAEGTSRHGGHANAADVSGGGRAELGATKSNSVGSRRRSTWCARFADCQKA